MRNRFAPPPPPMPKPSLHPAMAKRAAMVKEASAHLGHAIPGFHALPKAQKMMGIQEHIRARMGKK